MTDNEILYSDNWDSQTKENVKSLQGPVLIVGVSGFIGSKLYFSIKKIRDDVYACSRNPMNNWRLINRSTPDIINCDITDYEALKGLINSIKPMTVFKAS
jgi:nucleoside-diphosphate-sugar epimerase